MDFIGHSHLSTFGKFDRKYRSDLFHSFLVALVLGLIVSEGKSESPINERLGVGHVDGKYFLTKEDFLNEGADQILKIGSKVIKVYLTLDTDRPATSAYRFNTQWPEVKSLVDLSRTDPFRRLFDKPFTTFILTTFRPGKPAGYWIHGLTAEDDAEEERAFYEIAHELIVRYKGTGKTFVFQNWEGDWAVRGHFDPKIDPTDSALDNMTRWLAARQKGVDRARAELNPEGVNVWHAVEVNLIMPSMNEGRPSVINRVIPKVRPDLASYSAWESLESGDKFKKSLDFIASQMPHSSIGGKNVYVGEFGAPENKMKPRDVVRIIRDSTTASLDWGCPYVIYWQVYCNELKDEHMQPPVKQNSDVHGFWLLRPDGSKAIAWPILEKSLLP